jgi:hypothetical protein
VRSERAQLKTALKRGEASVESLISDPPQCLASAKVTEVLMALPGCGHIRAARLLERCRVSPRTSIRGLSQRQRDVLIRALKK